MNGPLCCFEGGGVGGRGRGGSGAVTYTYSNVSLNVWGTLNPDWRGGPGQIRPATRDWNYIILKKTR